MQEDFHYYATYCAAYLAGYSHEESMTICYSAQFVDLCSATLLSTLKAPREAATTQLALEMLDAKTDIRGLQNITRIWASFHFLPYNLFARCKGKSRRYRNKFRMICNSNSPLVEDTVNLARGKSLQAVGIAMHVLADTWAHKYFAGTPSMVINNTNYHFYEIIPDGEGTKRVPITFRNSASSPDDPEKHIYTRSLYQINENSIMNLGHGRAGHLPDYSFVRYTYLPAWGNYEEVTKDNPSDFYHAFAQMVYAMKFLRGEIERFDKGKYAFDDLAEYEDEIKGIIEKKQLDASADWKAFGEKLSGETIDAFDLERYQDEYKAADSNGKFGTFLGKFFVASMAHKSMVTSKIYRTGNLLAGISIDYDENNGFKGIQDYRRLLEAELNFIGKDLPDSVEEMTDGASDMSNKISEVTEKLSEMTEDLPETKEEIPEVTEKPADTTEEEGHE